VWSKNAKTFPHMSSILGEKHTKTTENAKWGGPLSTGRIGGKGGGVEGGREESKAD